ncbi:MAG: nicotinate (nicotinamide) nucleotide adenylyltransferase [Candidatus Gastranaerophilales bacterium]|nr:nicotinate (nicotinamide) nucleotide adenylyltransferase [Candidatus Gastranaerophilales bacterium]MCM1073640.1 nicotinate (nicotinamide) nucleotide adenylyltransferase [Bacteroides sp.]
MAICIFSGTFNPIHNAHIKMAEYALENYGFDKIIFIPAYLPPHKHIEGELASHRYKMVELATSKNPKFEVSDIEYKRNAPSYSLITVKKIIEQYNIDGRLNFIMGTDSFVKLNTWYKADELKELVHLIVFPRRGDGDEEIYAKFRADGWDFEVTNMDYEDVSSTEIRCAQKSDIDKKVEEYIKENGLYSNC